MGYVTERKTSKVEILGEKYELPYEHVKLAEELTREDILEHTIFRGARDAVKEEVKALVEYVNNKTRQANMKEKKDELEAQPEFKRKSVIAGIKKTLIDKADMDEDKAQAAAEAAADAQGL